MFISEINDNNYWQFQFPILKSYLKLHLICPQLTHVPV